MSDNFERLLEVNAKIVSETAEQRKASKAKRLKMLKENKDNIEFSREINEIEKGFEL